MVEILKEQEKDSELSNKMMIEGFGAHPTIGLKIVVSVLHYYTQDRTEEFLNHIPELLDNLSKTVPHHVSLIVRNNSPGEGDDWLINRMSDLQNRHKNINIRYLVSDYNLGFSKGHNDNFKAADSDLFIILNNDIGVPSLKFLEESLLDFQNHERLGAIGAYATPGRCQRDFGYAPDIHLPSGDRDYLEASILLVRSRAFEAVGMFDERFLYAFFEDSDLSLRLRQAGYDLRPVHISHQHFRSSSAKSIPETVLSSLFEHNRSRFFSKWSAYLKRNIGDRTRVSSKVLVDLSVSGFGDLFNSYLPARSLINELKSQPCEIYLNLRGTKTDFLFGGFPVTIVHDLDSAQIEGYKFDRISSIEDINYAPPFKVIDLISSKLGVINFDTSVEDLKKKLDAAFEEKNYISRIRPSSRRGVRHPGSHIQDLVVLHLDLQRTSFEGRAVNLERCLDSLTLLEGYTVAIIGMIPTEQQASRKFEEWVREHVSYDLRGWGSIEDAAVIINKAVMFYGIDSGPMNIAQLLDIPIFAIFGAIHPVARLHRREKSGAFVNDKLDCIGCYHDVIDLSYNFCMRRDEACVNDLDSAKLKDALADFLKEFRFEWRTLDEQFRAIQRRWFLTLMHNPLYKNRLLSRNNFSSKQFGDTIIQLTQLLEEKIDDKVAHRTAEYRGLKHKLDNLTSARIESTNRMRKFYMKLNAAEVELKKKTQQVSLLKKECDFYRNKFYSKNIANADGSVGDEQRSLIFTLKDFTPSNVRLVNAVALRTPHGITLEGHSNDPQMFLKTPISRMSGVLALNVTMVSAKKSTFEVFVKNAEGDEPFLEERKKTMPIMEGKNSFSMIIPCERDICLRIDPMSDAGLCSFSELTLQWNYF